jgi:uncharacterized protein YijF (DUF1287 family)
VYLRNGILLLGCENSDGNAIVASKPTQHANTLKSGWQNKNAFRFDVVWRKGDCASVVIQLAQDLSLRFEMADHLACHFERIPRNLSFSAIHSNAPPPALIDLTAFSGRNRLRFTLTLNMPGAVFGQIVGADNIV